MPTKSVILLDFDNIFLGLWKLDRDLAIRFAQTPLEWMLLLAGRHLTLDMRRWLVARCYLNPAGWVASSEEASGRLYLSRFRPALVRAGFEVIDCPGLTGEGKNAADIRIVIDALDLLRADCRYDEFVIASGDADFTPLLHRLRAADRRIAIIAPRAAASAYTSLADRVLGFDALEDVLRPQTTASHGEDASSGQLPAGNDALRSYICDRLQASVAPINLSSLAQDVDAAFPGARDCGAFGPGSFTAALRRLEQPGLQISQHFVWLADRHAPPQDISANATQVGSEVDQLIAMLAMPKLPRDTWPHVFDALARYSAEHSYDLADATRWTRDTLFAEGFPVSRNAMNYVVRGTQFGGAPLDSVPAPNARDIGLAFCSGLLERAHPMGIVATPPVEMALAARLGIDISALASDGAVTSA